MKALVGVAALLFLLRIVVAVVRVPPEVADALGVVLAVVFVALPILGIFLAAEEEWPARRGLLWLAAGLGLHGIGLALSLGLRPGGITGAIAESIVPTGLLAWCTGLGALIAAGLRDRNLLLPVAIFLAGFDVFLVTYPLSTTRQIMAQNPQVFESLAYAVPGAGVQGTGVGIPIAAQVGPADFLFLATFFIALFKFRMRTWQTLPWMVVTLVLYLLVVLLFGHLRLGPVALGALPALLPIGAVVLAVNMPEFKLKRDEKVATAVVGALALAIAAFGVIQAGKLNSARPAEPWTTPAGPGGRGSAPMP